MKLKNVFLAGLSVVLVAAIAVGGTLAYLTMDAGDESNVFSIGNIDISLSEDVDIFGEGGEVKKTENGAEYLDIMPGDYLKKEVTVTNNGKTPAYVAVTVLLNNADKINHAIDEVYGDGAEGGQAMYDFIFDGWGINQDPRPGAYGKNDARGVIDGTYGLPEHVLHVDFAKTIKGSTVISVGNWFTAGKEKPGQYWVDGPAAYDGYYTRNMNDYEICYTYYLYLPAGEATTLFNGLNVPAEFDNEQIKMFDGLKIDVEAKAIQADNMGVAEKYKDDANGKAKTAFAILAGDIKAEDAGVNNTPDTYAVDTVAELNAAIASAKDGDVFVLTDNVAFTGGTSQLKIEKAVTINLNGKTLSTEATYGGVILKGGASLVNGTVRQNGTVAAIKATDVEKIENVTIELIPSKSDRVTTGIAVQQYGSVGTIRNVTVTGASQGIEVPYGAHVDLIEDVTVTASANGSKPGYGMVINGGSVDKVINSSITGDDYGIEMHLKGICDVSLVLENCEVTGGTAGIYAWDENKNNTNSLTLNYDDATVINGGVTTDFSASVLPNVSINGVKGNQASVASNEELDAAIAAGKTELLLADGSYTIPMSAKGKTLTISGGKGAVINMRTDTDNYDASDYSLDGSTVTFNGITHQGATSGTAQGYARAKMTFNNCVLNGNMYLPETTVTTFNNCEFNVSGDIYCIWTWGSDEVYFNTCTFNSDGKALLVYNSACDVYVDNCTFNDRTNGTGFTKSALETGVDGVGPKYNIYITNTTVNGFAENDKCVGYENIVGNKNSMSKDYLNIVVDGVDVY